MAEKHKANQVNFPAILALMVSIFCSALMAVNFLQRLVPQMVRYCLGLQLWIKPPGHLSFFGLFGFDFAEFFQ